MHFRTTTKTALGGLTGLKKDLKETELQGKGLDKFIRHIKYLKDPIERD